MDDDLDLLPDIREFVNIAEGTTERVEIELKRCVKVRGRLVVEGTGKPIAGARVSISFGKTYEHTDCQTDEHGRFSAKVLPGKARVSVISFFGTGIRVERHPRIEIEVPEQAEFEIPVVKVAVKAN